MDSIEGVDTSKGEFYLVDNDKSAYLKTKDGVLWSPVTIDQLNQTTSSKNFVRRTNVPALHKTGLKHMSLKSGSWKGKLYSNKSNNFSNFYHFNSISRWALLRRPQHSKSYLEKML